MGVITKEMLQKFPEDKTNISIFTTKVMGTTFRKPEQVAAVETGDFVLIQPEIGNEYDPYACMVIHNDTGNHVGYLSSDFSEVVWKNITQRGDLYLGKCEKTGGTEGKQIGINLEIRHLRLKDN